MSTPFDRTINLIDEANAQDPHEECADGVSYPKELLYSLRMSASLLKLFPDASEHLRIAARGQHIERWKSPRAAYPEGRAGYKRWRAELGLFHAQRVGELMLVAGFAESDVLKVKYLLQKRGLGHNEQTQHLEDTACVVFIEHYLEDFAGKHTDDKLIDIIRKTWTKMSAHGQAAALDLTLPPTLQRLIGVALRTQ